MQVKSALQSSRARLLARGAVALLVPVLACLALGCENKSKAAKGEDPVPVTLASVETKDVAREIAAFGSVEASSTVDIRSQVPGTITEVHFHEGDFVKRGAALFTVDTRPYSASLAAAQADLARNQAVAQQTRVEAERASRMRVEGVASDQEVAKAQADAQSSAAGVKVVEAQIRSASLNVAFTHISSPIDGRTGSLMVHAGNIVKTSDALPMVQVRALSPVYVRFAVPQEYLSTIRQKLGHEPLSARVTTRGEGNSVVEAPVTFLENTVDTTTGTVMLKATYSNSGQELWPGASVDVVLVLGIDQQATVVPEPALQRSQSGTFVFVIGQDGRAAPRPVDVLRTTATEALIRSGLKAGEQVVTDGQLRLRKGTKVTSKASIIPADSSNSEQKRPEGL
jgi:multidrug efflux system membrane fusion protein